MYAIVETGGKQYKVSEGSEIDVEKIDAEVDDEVELDRVLLVRKEDETIVGTPVVEGARVVGRVRMQGRGPKIRVFKYKPKKGYRRRLGHRQAFTRLRIEKIEA